MEYIPETFDVDVVGPPEQYTKKELKALSIVLGAIKRECPDKRSEVWKSLPYNMKLEFNYCRWQR